MSKFNPANVEALYAISTAHVPLKELGLERQTLIFYPNEYGALIWVPTDDDWRENLCEADQIFAPMLEWARANKIVWLKLDADAPQIEEIPAFDHDAPEAA